MTAQEGVPATIRRWFLKWAGLEVEPMELRIAETNTSTYHYHLVEATQAALKQGQLKAICGKEFVGWETLIPIRIWGLNDHLPSNWCQGCTEARPPMECAC